jgi:hypothetical protein
MESYEDYNHHTLESCENYNHYTMEAGENNNHYTMEDLRTIIITIWKLVRTIASLV